MSNVIVTGTNIKLTEPLTEYVNEKLSRTLNKVGGDGARCDVHLVVNKNPAVGDGQKCEITTFIKGSVIRSVSATPDMYSSIDMVSDLMFRKLSKYKSRRRDGYHGGGGIGTNFAEELSKAEEVETAADAAADDGDDLYTDDEKPTITKIKSFDLGKDSAISIDEAVFALDYIDHDFYVFREAESGEISVVYKRNTGGVGLIQPTSD